jgi:plasmid stability protein
MPKVSTGIDEETYQALLVDAARHLRPAERHIAALLRQALGLPMPLPLCESGTRCEGNHGLVEAREEQHAPA